MSLANKWLLACAVWAIIGFAWGVIFAETFL